MTKSPKITVAPNGARLQSQGHANVPLTITQTAACARACFDAGAQGVHLHVRDAAGGHSLDAGLYRAAIAAVTEAAPQMTIQITTEAAGIYSVAEQLALLQDLGPSAASIAVREIARSPELARQVYASAAALGTQVQHILYGPSCFEQLEVWQANGTIPPQMRDAIVVLGQYHPPRAGAAHELDPMLELARAAALDLTVCAFGAQEQACLRAAAKAGCDLRIGFENNTLSPDGLPWPDNATAVAALVHALETDTCR